MIIDSGPNVCKCDSGLKYPFPSWSQCSEEFPPLANPYLNEILIPSFLNFSLFEKIRGDLRPLQYILWSGENGLEIFPSEAAAKCQERKRANFCTVKPCCETGENSRSSRTELFCHSGESGSPLLLLVPHVHQINQFGPGPLSSSLLTLFCSSTP